MAPLLLTSASASLEEAVDFLQLENAFLTSLLQRVAPALLRRPADADPDGPGREPLLLMEKQELCVAETAAVRRDMDRVQAEGELERACAQAAMSDAATMQAAETARDLVALLAVLGQPAPATAEAANALGAAITAAATAAPTCTLTHAAVPAQTVAAPDAGALSEPCTAAAGEPAAAAVGPPEASATAVVGSLDALPFALPRAKQLARCEVQGARLAHFMEDVLARHEANAGRLESRNAMLQGSLARVEAQLGARTELGAALRKVDFDALRIEHTQAEAELAAASTDAVALKAQVAAAAQRLAEQRAALAGTAADSEALARQAGVREGQTAVLRAEATKARRECDVLEDECAQLRGKRGGEGGVHGQPVSQGLQASSGARSDTDAGGPVTIMQYMQVKNACAETSKRIAGWQRKLEVQAGRQ